MEGSFTVTNRERLKAILRFEKPDYVPIFGFPGAGGMSQPPLPSVRERLVEQGMPEWVGADSVPFQRSVDDSWERYWGVTGPVYPPFSLAKEGPGVKCDRWVEGDFEIIEYETGARIRQVIDNDRIYIMPEFQSYHVRDRKSWEFYRELTAPRGVKPAEEIELLLSSFDPGDRLVAIGVGGTWGVLRSLMGPQRASLILFDDPALAHEIIDTQQHDFETFIVPLIERLRPDVLVAWEDCCYNHGMLISPRHFEEFCAPFYRRVCEVARDCGVDWVAIDSDGNIMEFARVVHACGVHTVYPAEAKAGNDLFLLREQMPDMILMGWLEKETVNEGNEHLIYDEIMSKVPPLLERGGYLPNLEHALQPLATFENVCKFMTLLHEVTGNPEGEFPRIH